MKRWLPFFCNLSFGSIKSWSLLDKSKGYGGGCTTAFNGIQLLHLQCAISKTTHLYPVQWKHSKSAKKIRRTDTKTVPAAKDAVSCASSTPELLLLSDWPKVILQAALRHKLLVVDCTKCDTHTLLTAVQHLILFPSYSIYRLSHIQLHLFYIYQCFQPGQPTRQNLAIACSLIYEWTETYWVRLTP